MALTFCLLKPDAGRRRLVPDLLDFLDGEGLVPVRMELRRPARALVREHYRAHRDWDGFEALVEFTCSGPVVALVLAASHPAEDAIALLRDAIGPFDERIPGTIRGEWMTVGRPSWENLIHGSDSAAEAEREATLWFGPGGLAPLAAPEERDDRDA
jgi:nucleoside-diphosphate kinase